MKPDLRNSKCTLALRGTSRLSGAAPRFYPSFQVAITSASRGSETTERNTGVSSVRTISACARNGAGSGVASERRSTTKAPTPTATAASTPMLANSGARPGCRWGAGVNRVGGWEVRAIAPAGRAAGRGPPGRALGLEMRFFDPGPVTRPGVRAPGYDGGLTSDRKSTRLNSSHLVISYAVF